jgi:acyl-coenzyme A synthetase/AMP-(fatty) acid ligase
MYFASASKKENVVMATFCPRVPDAAIRRLARTRSGAFQAPLESGSAVKAQ